MCQQATSLAAEPGGESLEDLRKYVENLPDDGVAKLDLLFNKVWSEFFEIKKCGKELIVEIDINPNDTDQPPYSLEEKNNHEGYFTFRLTLKKYDDQWIPIRLEHIQQSNIHITIYTCDNPRHSLPISTRSLTDLKNLLDAYIRSQKNVIRQTEELNLSTRHKIMVVAAIIACSLGIRTLLQHYPIPVNPDKSTISGHLHQSTNTSRNSSR